MEPMFNSFPMEVLLFGLIGLAYAIEFFDNKKRSQQEDLSSSSTTTHNPSLQQHYHRPQEQEQQQEEGLVMRGPFTPFYQTQLINQQVEVSIDYESEIDPTPGYYDTNGLTSVVGDIELVYESDELDGIIMKYEPPPPYSLYPQGTRRKIAKNKIKSACKRMMRIGI